MKKFILGLLIGALCMVSITAFASLKINKSPYPIFVDGKQAKVDAYAIDGSTYLKLTDLNVTGLDVKFNSSKKQIEIKTPSPVTTSPSGINNEGGKKAMNDSKMPQPGSKEFDEATKTVNIDIRGAEVEDNK